VANTSRRRRCSTDNSRRYTTGRGTSRFGAEPRKDGVIHIKARPQHPMTLGKIEHLWASIWGEFQPQLRDAGASRRFRVDQTPLECYKTTNGES